MSGGGGESAPRELWDVTLNFTGEGAVRRVDGKPALPLLMSNPDPLGGDRYRECLEFVRNAADPEPTEKNFPDQPPRGDPDAYSGWFGRLTKARDTWSRTTQKAARDLLESETTGASGEAFAALCEQVASTSGGGLTAFDIRAAARVLGTKVTKKKESNVMSMSNSGGGSMADRARAIRERDRCSFDESYSRAAAEVSLGVPMMLSGSDPADPTRVAASRQKIEEAWTALYPAPVGGGAGELEAYQKWKAYGVDKILRGLRSITKTEDLAAMMSNNDGSDDPEMLAMSFAEHVNAVAAKYSLSRTAAYDMAHAARRAAGGER